MRILLVEDDAEVARFVRKGLVEAGHVVEHAANGRDGLFLAASEQFDVLVLDRMLPGGVDGVRLVETLRGQANRTPVFLTFPLMFCFAPAVLILLMSPSFMQLSEFLSPSNTRNPLANNESISTDRIVETLESLDQSIPQNTSPAGRPSLAPPAGSPTR